MKVNWLEALIIGIAAIAIVLPTAEKSLQRRHIDLNGIVGDFTEAVREAVARQVDTAPSPEE